jgi:hypothetical protein
LPVIVIQSMSFGAADLALFARREIHWAEFCRLQAACQLERGPNPGRRKSL